MKKLLLVVLYVLITAMVLGCSGGSPASVGEVNGTGTTTQAVGTVAEVTPQTAVVSLPSTTPTGAGSPAASAPNASVLAEKAVVAVGDSFQIVVAVDIMDKMSRGAECGLSWTPASLAQCTGVADGDFYAKLQPVHMGASGTGAIHNDTGSVASMGQFCTGDPIDAGASGKGVLFIYTFKALKKGEITFSIPADSLLVGDVTGDSPIQIESVSAAKVSIQ